MSELRKPDGVSQEWWDNASEKDRNDVWNESIFYEGGNYVIESQQWTDGVGSTKLSNTSGGGNDDTIVWARPRVNKGTNEPEQAALLAVSGADKPLTLPFPNFCFSSSFTKFLSIP